MRRLLAAAALGLGMLATTAPAADACAFQQCPYGQITCSVISCPLVCTPRLPVLNHDVCVFR
jgi:hypothetical protein